MVETPLPPAARCPHCRAALDAAQSPFDAKRRPRAGDASFCIRCGQFSVFHADLTLRPPSKEEYAEIMDTEEAQQIKWVWVKHNLLGMKGGK